MRKQGQNPPFVILIGTNGTGKSTRMKELLKAQNRNLIIPANYDDSQKTWGFIDKVLVPQYKWVLEDRGPGKKKANKKRWYIPELNTFKGNAKIHLDAHDDLDPTEIFRIILHHKNGFKNGGLFMDDCKNYIISKGSLPHWIRSIFVGRRHKNLSLYAAGHGYDDINHDMVSFNPIVLMHYVTKNPTDTWYDRLNDGDAERFKKTFEKVQSIYRTNQYVCAKFVINDPNSQVV